MIINTTNLNEARKQILKSKEQTIIVWAQNPEFNRKIIEYGKFYILLFPEQRKKHNKLKFLDSGFNHIIAKLAAKNKITIAYDISIIKNLEKKEKALELSRLKQNIKICRKAKTVIKLLNVKDEKDAQALLISLGASTQQTIEGL